MTSNYILMGKLTHHEREMDDNAEHTVVAATDDRRQSRVIESIYVSASAAETIDISIKSGATTLMMLAQVQPVEPDTPLHIINHPRVLKPGERITAEAGTGGLAWISVITVDLPIQGGAASGAA